MVPIRRPGLHHRLGVHGLAHGARHRISVLWSISKKVGIVSDLGRHDVLQRHHLPVVLLGLLAGLQLDGHQRLYRRLTSLRSHEHTREAFARITAHS